MHNEEELINNLIVHAVSNVAESNEWQKDINGLNQQENMW